MTEILHQIILRIWCEEQLPTDWLDGLVTPIYKKGQRLDCANYRGITILNAAYKVLSRILWSKLRPMTETFVGEYQCGFRAGRSTTDQMFTLRQILDKFREYNLQTHHLFIDFKAAYDSVKRNEIWKIMVEHGFPAKLIRLIRATLDGAKSSVRIANETSEAFVTLDGLKQGDALSNLLFIIALEGAARRAGVQRNGTLITKSHMLLDTLTTSTSLNNIKRSGEKPPNHNVSKVENLSHHQASVARTIVTLTTCNLVPSKVTTSREEKRHIPGVILKIYI
ncbi:uncharacterized protein LOC119769006 [Culex quinquefasciatus]|uniref:uncharacterized protein LOC119769006 n=1 Tax=Culex quinquefasciatus TaxID=7176 RepID=UPI0018E331CD|nr:uncharacterized protein LOC119769006 [Culex quinquefasciatus]